MASKDKARAKALELEVGRAFGGRRRRSGEGIEYDDCVSEDGSPLWISIEAKAGYERPTLRADWLTQARRNCDGRPWMLVQRPKHSKTTYVTLDLGTVLWLATLAGKVPPGGDA